MSISRQALRSVRALHTTSRLLNDTPAPKSLGFGDYTGRTRSLPTINIPASGRLNLNKRNSKSNSNSDSNPKVDTKKQSQPRANAAGRGGGGGDGARKFPEERRKRQSRSPLVQSKSKTQTSTTTPSKGVIENGNGDGDGEFFTHTEEITGAGEGVGSGSRKTTMDAVDIEFNPDTAVPTRQIKSRGGRNVNAASTSSGSGKKVRGEKRSTGSAPATREDDRSSEGIFGRASLLFPLRRGARQAEQSVWAEGMKAEDARKAELERLIGKPTAYLPQSAYPTDLSRDGKKAAGESKNLASWIMSTNPGISMRRERTGQAVLETYLK